MKAIMSILEFISILLIHNIISNKKIFDNIKQFIVISVLGTLIIRPILLLPGFNGGILAFIILFTLSIIISIINKKEQLDVFFELCAAQVVLLILQFFIDTTLFILVFRELERNILSLSIVMLFILIIIMILYNVNKNIGINLAQIIKKYKQVNVFILNSILIMFLVKLFVMNFEMKISIMIQILGFLILLVSVNCYYIMNEIKNNRKDKKKEIEDNINPLIDDLMTSLKASEHEYKNHLNMLYCMVQVCNEGEVKQKVKDYIGDINKNDSFLEYIARIENTIVKALLFSKVQEAENNDIEFSYTIDSNLKRISLDDSELTVLLSNLLNNAIEGSSESEEKIMALDIYEEDGQYIIYIKNSIGNMKKGMLKNMFKEGYSTKGDNRGYGLFNIKKILDKHRGKLYHVIDESSIEFNIELPMIE